MGGSQSNLCKGINLLSDRYRLEKHAFLNIHLVIWLIESDKRVNIDSCFVARGITVREFIPVIYSSETPTAPC